MSFLEKVFGASDIVEGVTKVVDQFHTSETEKHAMKLSLEKVVTERLALIQQEVVSRFEMVFKVIQAEMASGDNYTKRARPTLVYFGMAMIFINYVLVPTVQTLSGSPVQPFGLPTEFWIAWGGTVGLWTVGRSAEKSGIQNKATSLITGSKRLDLDRLL